MPEINIEGKVTIVTGGNAGIGLETARGFAKRGARVILTSRNEENGRAAVEDVRMSTGNDNVVCKLLDLASFKSIRGFAADINQSEDSIDILVCNAGISIGYRTETEDGIESTFGVNHLGHFLLVNLLLDKIKASQPSRIVIVSSEAHKYSKANLDDIQQTKSQYNGMKAYNMSKTCNILFGAHLARLLKDTDVTTYSLHPGVVKTSIFQKTADTSGGCLSCLIGCLLTCFPCCMKTPEQGAATSLYCALETKLAQHSGRYYSGCKEQSAKNYATDPEIAAKLWTLSEEMCDLT